MPEPGANTPRSRWRGGLWALGVGVFLFCGASTFVALRFRARIVPAAQAPEAPVAVIFGAGLTRDGPSNVLAERMDMGVALWRGGKVKKLLLSGDNSDRHHDETRAMRRYALAAGIPEEAVLLDHAGLSTYDSCYRARTVYGVDRAILVSQAFHLPRALYIANRLGMDAWGVASDEEAPDHWRSEYALREFFSRALAAGMVALKVKPQVEGHAQGPAARRSAPPLSRPGGAEPGVAGGR